MRYQYLLAAGAVFVIACEALFGNLSAPNNEYCDPGDGRCGAGFICDPLMNRCVADANADGGNGVDGGVVPPASNREFFGADPIFLPIGDTGAPNAQAVLYRGDFDGNGVPDIFVMGQTRYFKVMNPGAGGAISGPFTYKLGGNPEAVAIGRLDGDSKDDIAIILDGASPNLEVLLSGDGSDTATVLATAVPRAIGIGDFNGDLQNDIAIGYLNGNVELRYAGNPVAKQIVAADVTVPISALITMTVPPYKYSNKTQDVLVGIRSAQPTMVPNRMKIIRGNTANEPTVDSIDLSGGPDEFVIGQFTMAGQYDAAVLVEGSGLDVLRNLQSASPLPARSSVTFGSLRIESAQPNKGKLAAGRLTPNAQARGVDDLAVLMQDGQLAVYGGGTNFATEPPLVAGRGLAAEKILAGAFSVGSPGDALAGYSDTAQGASLAVSRYFGSGQGALPNLAQQVLTTASAGTGDFVLTGAFSTLGAREFALVSSSASSAALRCAASAASTYACTSPLVLSGTVMSAAVVTCADRRSRILAGRSDKQLQIIDLSATGASAAAFGPSTPAIPLQIESADLNGDDQPDIVVRLLGGKIVRSFSNATCPSWDSLVDITPAGAMINRIALVDVNGDGKADLVTGESNKVTVFLNSNNGMFSTGATYSTTGNLAGAAAGDFRGNSPRELAVMLMPEPSGNSKLVWLSAQITAATTTLTETFKADLPHRYEQMAAADA